MGLRAALDAPDQATATIVNLDPDRPHLVVLVQPRQ
jgi:hypothetical protein